ncbi:Uncharacterized protein SCF082_LOCUS45475 [Durusdinium trenchii]|uniref:Uncharacterized protein n=1 Tax=Durusdinium trenchii TaxID=1381693 RepID=A0ABP0RC60_9DINO
MGSRKGGKPPGRPRQPKEKLEIRDVMHEWDQSDEVRDRMRNDGVLMHPKSSPSEDIPTCIKNATLLQPLLTRMGMMQTRSLPLIDELRGEVEGLFRKNKLGDQAENGSIVIESKESLKGDIAKIDNHYDSCTEAWTKGEAEGFFTEGNAKKFYQKKEEGEREADVSAQASFSVLCPSGLEKASEAQAFQVSQDLRVALVSLGLMASCASAIDAARAIVEDVGPEAAELSGGLNDLARCQPKNSERDCHRTIVKKFGLALQVPKSQLKTEDPQTDIPTLRIPDWCAFLLRNNSWHILSGLQAPDQKRQELIFTHFWKSYEQQDPNHPIFEFARNGEVVLGRVAPLLLHGDEGRSRKHSPFLDISFFSPLGRGINAKSQFKHYIKMLPNFKGHSYTNRFLYAACRKADYTGDNESNFRSLMQGLATDSVEICRRGVLDEASGLRHWAMVIGVCGDWPWLVKAGDMNRSYMNLQKHIRAGAVDDNKGGICHLCEAGRRRYNFEQIETRRPDWLQSMHQSSPFRDEGSPLLNIPHSLSQGAGLFKWNVFHTWHLGVSKSYIGSVLVLLAEQECAGLVDRRFDLLSRQFKAWCSRFKRRSHCRVLSKEMLGWSSSRVYPNGSWHKGELSTVRMEFLEWRFKQMGEEAFEDEPMLVKAAQACYSI